LVGYAVLGPRVVLADDGDHGVELDPARAATMTALVAALAAGPAAGVDPDAYTADFAAFYAASEPPFRGLADGALDRLAPLAEMGPVAGLAALEAMTFDPARRLDVADGLTLAGLTFGSEERGEAGYVLATVYP
jgi:hypothetical protein